MRGFGIRRVIAMGLALALVAGAVVLPAGSALAADTDTHELNLKNADIGALIDDVSLITGYTFIIDPRVKGTVTVISSAPISSGVVFKVFLSTLRVHGYTAVPVSEGIFKIVPDENALSDGAVLPSTEGFNEVFVTDVIKLSVFDAVEAAKMIKPMIHRQGHVAADPKSNILIVVDAEGNLQRIRQVLADLDRDRSVFEVVGLKNMAANELARILASLQRTDSSEDAALSGLSIVPVEGTNRLLIKGEPAAVKRMVKVARRLDDLNESDGNLDVIYLSNARAEDLVPILQEITKDLTANSGATASIAFHAATNALIINADQDTKKALANVVQQLDVRRAQVMVEAIVVEVSDQAARQLGLQFLVAGSEDNQLPFAATNFSRSAPNLLALSGAIASADGDQDQADPDLVDAALSSLLNLNGIVGGVGGVASDGTLFGVILDAVEEDTGSNVLSTPLIMTLDNEPASFMAGQEIPITTGETLGTDNANPFRTIDRQDVGIKLSVKPQINEGDSIRLYIRQEVSSVFGPVGNGFNELVTNKRELETTVLADDGEVIVLGGLIEESSQVSESKVPLLGDIPGLGRLFKSKGRSKGKTNLMVFIRPTIIRDVDDARVVANRKYDYIQAQQVLRGTKGDEALDNVLRDLIGDDRLSRGGKDE